MARESSARSTTGCPWPCGCSCCCADGCGPTPAAAASGLGQLLAPPPGPTSGPAGGPRGPPQAADMPPRCTPAGPPEVRRRVWVLSVVVVGAGRRCWLVQLARTAAAAADSSAAGDGLLPKGETPAAALSSRSMPGSGPWRNLPAPAGVVITDSRARAHAAAPPPAACLAVRFAVRLATPPACTGPSWGAAASGLGLDADAKGPQAAAGELGGLSSSSGGPGRQAPASSVGSTAGPAAGEKGAAARGYRPCGAEARASVRVSGSLVGIADG